MVPQNPKYVEVGGSPRAQESIVVSKVWKRKKEMCRQMRDMNKKERKKEMIRKRRDMKKKERRKERKNERKVKTDEDFT